MNSFIRAKQVGARYVKNAKRVAAGAAVTVLAASPAFAAAPAQPDVTEVVAYILATTATVALIGNAGLMVKVAVRVYGWIRGAIR
jgi:hypothetical protein